MVAGDNRDWHAHGGRSWKRPGLRSVGMGPRGKPWRAAEGRLNGAASGYTDEDEGFDGKLAMGVERLAHF